MYGTILLSQQFKRKYYPLVIVTSHHVAPLRYNIDSNFIVGNIWQHLHKMHSEWMKWLSVKCKKVSAKSAIKPQPTNQPTCKEDLLHSVWSLVPIGIMLSLMTTMTTNESLLGLSGCEMCCVLFCVSSCALCCVWDILWFTVLGCR